VNVATVYTPELRLHTPMFQMGLFDRAPGEEGDVGANVTTAAHGALAREIAAASTVLLKNAGQDGASGSMLPLRLAKGRAADEDEDEGKGKGEHAGEGSVGVGAAQATTLKTLAVVGPAAAACAVIHGGGSGHVDPPYVITGLQV
jgi:beta-glucosidase